MKRWCYIILAALSLMTACQDDKYDITVPESAVTLSESRIDVGPLGRYYTLSVRGVADTDSVLSATPSASWVEVDELWSSVLRIYVRPNKGVPREATVTLTTKNGSKATLTLIQHSDNEQNALTGDSLSRVARVGFGYNLAIDYMDVKSATEPVFDYNALKSAETEWGIIIAQDHRNRLDYKLHTAYSIVEMAENLMSEQTDGVSFLGLSKTVSKYLSIKTFESDKQSYGFGKITKVVATRYIDMGKIDAIIREGNTSIFTSDFREYYNAVHSDPSEENVRKLVDRFGTHIVTYADLGGRLEYTINFQAEQVSREEMEYTMKYKNGNLQECDEKRQHEKLDNINSSMNVTVYGGDPAARESLQTASPTTDTNQQIPRSLLEAWTATIADEDSLRQNLVMASCHMTPIWQLFPEEHIRNAVLGYIIRMADAMVLSPETLLILGLEGYRKFSVTNLKLDDFGSDDNSTLIKVAYVKGVPLLEICNEYVPEIRGDRRVTIVYPIYNQKTNIRRGIFTGNGENPPCEISFDDYGGCYVAQLDGYGPGETIDSLFYIDGALYDSDMNVPVVDASNATSITPQYLDLGLHYWFNVGHGGGMDLNHETTASFPYVKIGPGYWTRSFIKDKDAQLLSPEMPEGMQLRVVENSEISWGTNWRIPTKDHIHALMQYIGNNAKALFPNQQSGLNIAFRGYEVRVVKGEFTVTTVETRTDRKGCCVIASMNGSDDIVMLVLKPDYTSFFESVPSTAIVKEGELKNYYHFHTIGYRSSHYSYPTK